MREKSQCPPSVVEFLLRCEVQEVAPFAGLLRREHQGRDLGVDVRPVLLRRGLQQRRGVGVACFALAGDPDRRVFLRRTWTVDLIGTGRDLHRDGPVLHRHEPDLGGRSARGRRIYRHEKKTSDTSNHI